jgi:RNA polymerase sigma-70 factor (ECF subfamily)
MKPAPSLNETDLLGRIRKKDAAAMDQLYTDYSAVVYGTLLRMVQDRETASDLLQEVFLQIWNKADRFDPSRGSLIAWIMSVTRNLTIDFIRSKAQRTASLQVRMDDEDLHGLMVDHHTPLDHVALDEKRRLVQIALNELAPEQRECLELAYFGCLSQSEIAEKLGIPLGTVKTRTRQALQKLSAALARTYEEVGR